MGKFLKIQVLILLIACSLFLLAVEVLAETCEQNDFGSSSIDYYIYSSGKSWSFTAQNNMHVTGIEVMSVFSRIYHSNLGGYLLTNVDIKINGEVLASWSVSSTETHTEAVDYALQTGDEITYYIYGGTSSMASGIISGPNYVKLCGDKGLSVSPTVFSSDTLSTVAVYDSPGTQPNGLAFDGTYLWNADYDDNIYKLDTEGNILNSIVAPGSTSYGLTSDGSHLWNTDYNEGIIYKLNTSGNILDYFNSPGSKPLDLAFDGTHLFNSDSETGKVYKLDTSGNVLDSFDFDCSGLTFDGQFLWATDSGNGGKIYKLDTSGNIKNTYDSPGSWPRGLTFDGTYLWNTDNSNDKIYKLEPPLSTPVGTETIKTFTLSNSGDTAVTVNEIIVGGSDASQFRTEADTCSRHTLDSQGSCSLNVIFSPFSSGEKHAELQILSNDSVSPVITIPLEATASGDAMVTPPLNPTITVSTNGTTINLSWSADNADSYILYAAPFPDATPIYEIEMGSQTSASFTLPNGAAYFVAIKAFNSAGESDYSNIEYFIL